MHPLFVFQLVNMLVLGVVVCCLDDVIWSYEGQLWCQGTVVH